MITPEDLAFAREVIDFTPGAFLGGSYIVKGMDASDIDVIIPHREWPSTRAHFAGRIEKVLKDVLTELEDKPDLADDERLITVYRRGAVDLIVIKDEYIDSYRKAVADMASDPLRFAERPARVAIHVHYADEYRLENGLPLEAEIKARRNASGRHGGGEYKV